MFIINVRILKGFKHYLDFPSDVRMVIVDEMQPDDRCRFTRCSKICNKEAKSSKKYINYLKINATREYISICVGFNKYPEDHQEFLGYVWTIVKNEGKNIEFKTNKIETYYWLKDLGRSANILLHAADRFKELLGMCQNTIKSLELSGNAFHGRLRDYDFEIEGLRNLETLRTNCGMNSFLRSTKFTRRLKDLHCDERNIANCELIYQIQGELILPITQLSYEQMLQLSASTVTILIGTLSEEDIFNFIQSWQNRTLRQEVHRYTWRNIRESNFDVNKLFRLLEANHDNFQSRKIDIKHSPENGKIGELSYDSDESLSPLVFQII